ncbi:hypothetical protein RO3G_07449 [Rhizopus delemar RA 99-880]|uniref:Uncharacterized protein n=1 Tax=Rhizopus delemar (strain RA 99-880 / ATCC MYA-4621 / FGSC 9543 / NRRL 43880) TaxID=246409 RepID=I1C2R4_RHIO9|nr:hypothetical protein RO3G_07449 [Rhizopus delemar RA 99-880]|eukprot:EIE82744.1 hypothetical protein RO3G_07449 [Rhizopus delemar RA 99-880]
MNPVMSTRTTLNTLKLGREKVLEWKNGKNMIWNGICVFIDEAGLNMHIHRNFGKSKAEMIGYNKKGRYHNMDNAAVH